MQLEEPVPYLGAISFRIWVIKASIPNLTCSDPLYCKIEVHASKGPVKYRYKAVTQDSQEDFSWIKEPFEFPLDPSPTLVRIICLQRTCASSSGKVIGEIQLDSEAIETLEHNSGKDTSNLVLKNLDTNNSEKYNIIRNATISYQLKFNIDKVKHAYYLFSKFPEEILLQIFSFVDPDTLYNISLVCRKWNSLAQDDELVFTIAKRAQRNENFLGAHKLYIFSAKKGNGASMDELGRIYQHGIGFDKDNSKAFMWYKRAAKQGNPSGMNDIGWCYEKGLGCVKNEEKAAKWYLRSAEAGNMSGENNIGWCYQKGLGTPVDYKSAVKWYRRASQHGNSSGYNNLAWCYHQGLGVDQDYKQAMKTYKMAAKLGNKFAQNTIGNLYFNGQGVEVNLEKAIKWFEKAANQGHEAAKGRLALLCEKPGQTAAEDIL